MTRVYPALSSRTVKPQGTIPLDAITEWMASLRAMPYRFSPYWQTPTEVNINQAADCKGKAVALYAQMRRLGAKSVRVVIGRRHLYDSNTHAWLEWETNQGSYMLDPTFNEIPVRMAEVDPMTYVASYAFDGEHKYRATRSSLVASNTRVATGYNDHLYVPARAATSMTQSGFTGFGSPQFYPPTTQYGTSQYRPAVNQNSWPQTQISSPYAARPISPVVASNPVPMSPTYQRPIQYQIPNPPPTRLTTQVRAASIPPSHRAVYSTSNSVRHRHVRHLAQHRKHLAQPRRLVSQS